MESALYKFNITSNSYTNRAYFNKSPAYHQRGLVTTGKSWYSFSDKAIEEIDQDTFSNHVVYEIGSAQGDIGRDAMSFMYSPSRELFYGSTQYSTNSSQGTLFTYDSKTNIAETKHLFGNEFATRIWATLFEGTDGHLYGFTTEGSPLNPDIISYLYQITPNNTVVHLYTGKLGISDVIQPKQNVLLGSTGTTTLFSYDLEQGSVDTFPLDKEYGYPVRLIGYSKDVVMGVSYIPPSSHEKTTKATLFSFDLNTHQFTLEATFSVAGEIFQPQLVMVNEDTLLFINELGGKDDKGMLVRFDKI